MRDAYRRPGAARRGFVLALAALLLGGMARAGQSPGASPPARRSKVRLLQGNVPQQMKFEPAVARQTMQRYLELVEAEPADLIVLPETAWTVPWAVDTAGTCRSGSSNSCGRRAPRWRSACRSRRRVPGAGGSRSAAPRNDTRAHQQRAALRPRGRRRRRAPGALRQAPPGALRRVRPWGFRWFVDLMTIPLGDFGRGSPDQPPFAVGDQRISFNICYEDVFGEELLPALQRRATAPPSSPTSATSPGSAIRTRCRSTCRSRGCARSRPAGR